MPVLSPSPWESQLKWVQGFDELISIPFKGKLNAVGWQRSLDGDFGNIVQHLPPIKHKLQLDRQLLEGLQLSPQGRIAANIMLEDFETLAECGLDPSLEAIVEYPKDPNANFPTDVYSFHIDSATVETDTYLCTYHGSPSEILAHHEAQLKIQIPEIRAQLFEQFGSQDSAKFNEFLVKKCYNLHYQPLPDAQPLSLGQGNLWRLAVQHPHSQVPACIHRAPEVGSQQPTRLLLIC
jgi:hypothetical protein